MKLAAKDEAQRLVATLHPLERAAVPHLKANGTLAQLARDTGQQEVETMRVLQWLESKGCLNVIGEETQGLLITDKGKHAHAHGLPETHAIAALKKQGLLAVSEIPKTLPAYDKEATGAVIGALKAAGIPFITTPDGKPAFRWIAGMPEQVSLAARALAEAAKRDWWLAITDENRAAAEELLRRKGYAERHERKEKRYALTPLGERLTRTKLGAAAIERVTPAILKDGAWQGKEFRAYDVAMNVPKTYGGRAHFVREAIERIRRIWLELGFEEMTGADVQTAFWDLDSLFVPQDHPAREMQDTFYLKDPAKGKLPKDLFAKVKAVHEHGGDTGSLGWRMPFSKEESEKNMLRTHTTVLSAQTLDAIRRGEKKIPGKYFSVAKVYRNEALDWKHLFEFYQVEGIVVDEEANLQHLKGYLRLFFTKMGFTDVRIRPAHFPYTEPSAEVDVYDPKKRQWVELGGAGIFRPEVTKTLIGKEVPVLAWGLGMERIIKEHYGITDIRDLYRNDARQLKETKVWR